MSIRIPRKNLWLGLATTAALAFVVTIPVTAVARSHGYCPDAWSFPPINVVIGFVCGCVGFGLFPITPGVRDDEGPGPPCTP